MSSALLALAGVLFVACESRPVPPANLRYADAHVGVRRGESLSVAAPGYGGGAIATFSIAPPLPAGLVLDAQSGAISGTPTGEQPARDYVVTGRGAAGSATAALSIAVGPELPAEVVSLEAGFAIERVAAALDVPVRLAFAPDGRLFFNELTTGRIRILAVDGRVVPAPFATLPVLGGGHRGLLGLALAPDFTQSGEVFVSVCSPAEAGHADRLRVVRFVASGDTGTGPTVVLDDLPLGVLNNGGALAFDATGHLLLAVGDTEDPALAQDRDARAGRLLRFTRGGGVPIDNPFAGRLEWCRGLRNTFALAVHPLTGGVFGADNGPASDDELNFLQPGTNFEWGGLAAPGTQGFKIRNWADVIVPTALVFHQGNGLPAEYAGNLFLATYDDQSVRRLVLSGSAATDLDAELPFVTFVEDQVAHKPLDLAVGPDGALWVSTFTAIWRIRRL